MRQRLLDSHRLVVKVGSALVTDNGTGLDLVAIAEWARQIAQLREDGRQVALVSSGRHCTGCNAWDGSTAACHARTAAAAAVGQMGLVQAYGPFFPAWLEDCSDFADS